MFSKVARMFCQAPTDLLQLDVPVAEIVVDEVPDDLRRFVIAERADGGDSFRGRTDSGGD